MGNLNHKIRGGVDSRISDLRTSATDRVLTNEGAPHSCKSFSDREDRGPSEQTDPWTSRAPRGGLPFGGGHACGREREREGRNPEKLTSSPQGRRESNPKKKVLIWGGNRRRSNPRKSPTGNSGRTKVCRKAKHSVEREGGEAKQEQTSVRGEAAPKAGSLSSGPTCAMEKPRQPESHWPPDNPAAVATYIKTIFKSL